MKIKTEKQIIDYEIHLPVKLHRYKGAPHLIYSHPHFHNYEIEIQFIIDGDGAYFIKNRKYTFEKKKVLVIHKGEGHYFIPGEKEIEKITVMVKKEIFDTYQYLLLPIFECRKGGSHEIFLPDRDFLKALYFLKR